MVPVSCTLLVQLLPVDDAYCSDQPAKLTALVPVLRSSTKSALNGAPLLPPPPYTWLMTTAAEAGAMASPISDKARAKARGRSGFRSCAARLGRWAVRRAIWGMVIQSKPHSAPVRS